MPPPRKITEDLTPRIIEQLKRGKTLTEVGEELGVTRSAVSKHLRKRGIPIPVRKRGYAHSKARSNSNNTLFKNKDKKTALSTQQRAAQKKYAREAHINQQRLRQESKLARQAGII